MPNLVVTARDTEVRRRPAACVVASDVDSDADVVLDAPAVSEVPDVPTEPTAIDVLDKTVLQLCSRQEQQRLELKKYTWRWYKNHQNVAVGQLFGDKQLVQVGRRDHTQVFLAETSRASRLTVDRRRTRRDRCMAKGVVQMIRSSAENNVRILPTSSHNTRASLAPLFSFRCIVRSVFWDHEIETGPDSLELDVHTSSFR